MAISSPRGTSIVFICSLTWSASRLRATSRPMRPWTDDAKFKTQKRSRVGLYRVSRPRQPPGSKRLPGFRSGIEVEVFLFAARLERYSWGGSTWRRRKCTLTPSFGSEVPARSSDIATRAACGAQTNTPWGQLAPSQPTPTMLVARPPHERA